MGLLGLFINPDSQLGDIEEEVDSVNSMKLVIYQVT